MKKTNKLFLSISLVLLAIVFASCASKGETLSGDKISTKTTDVGEVKGIPDFYLNPPVSADVVYGVGSSKLKKLDASRKASLAKARDDVAFQVRTQIESSISDYYKENGVDEDSTAEAFYESISNQVANTILNGVTTEKVVAAKDGTVYTLVSFPKENILSEAELALAKGEGNFDGYNSQDALQVLSNNMTNNPTIAGQNQ